LRFKDGVKEEKDVKCVDPDDKEIWVKVPQARYWVESGGDWNILRNNQPWDPNPTRRHP
jgi:hypothetical protein